MWNTEPERFYPKEIKELNEIAEKIASKTAPITWDDILDFFLELNKYEKKLKRSKPKKSIFKKERKIIRCLRLKKH